MRLTKEQCDAITEVFKLHFLENDKLWLFGSRVDDAKSGGDIDLYIETHYINSLMAAENQMSFLSNLKQKIGDQKIDLVMNVLKNNQQRAIHEEAKKTGIQLI